MGKYLKASNKQMDYIDILCVRLQIPNPTLYSRPSLERATKLINRLKKQVDKQKGKLEQLRLL